MRPLSAGELLEAAFGAVQRNFRVLALCTLVAVAPVTILATLVEAATTEGAFDFSADTAIDEDELGAYIAGSAITGLLGLVASVLATAACLRAVGGAIFGATVTASESLGYAFARLGPLLWVAVLTLLAALGGLLLLVVGAIWLGVLFSLATPALLFEDRRGAAALGRSRDLMRDNWWRVFGVLVVMYLIAFVIQGVLVGALTALLADSGSEALNAVLLTVANLVSSAVTLPLVAALTTYVYFDLRVRKEGLDPEAIARGFGSGPSATVAGLPAESPPGGGFLPPRPPGT